MFCIHSFINEAYFEYWKNIGRQNTLLAYFVSVRNRVLVAMLNPTLHKAYYLVGSFSRWKLRVLKFFPLLQKKQQQQPTKTFQTFTSILTARSLLNNFLINLKCFGDKQLKLYFSFLFIKFVNLIPKVFTSITYVTIGKLQSSLSIYE